MAIKFRLKAIRIQRTIELITSYQMKVLTIRLNLHVNKHIKHVLFKINFSLCCMINLIHILQYLIIKSLSLFCIFFQK
jgi:hypothetical protein